MTTTRRRTSLRAYGMGVGHPRGPKYPNSRVLSPKIHTQNGFWTLKPYYLGTWALRESETLMLKLSLKLNDLLLGGGFRV